MCFALHWGKVLGKLWIVLNLEHAIIDIEVERLGKLAKDEHLCWRLREIEE